MPLTPIVFGSSKDIILPFWRVWFYNAENKESIPLAHYWNKFNSDIAAFNLAHSVASMSDVKEQDEVLKLKDQEPKPLSDKLQFLFGALAEKAITASEEPTDGKSAVTVHTTPDDTVYAVRLPE
jgi:hypothetical protein